MASSDAHEVVIYIDPDVFFSTGAPGPTGPQGSIWYYGEGPPDIALGDDNDWYLDTASHQIYVKEAGTWSYQTTLSGTANHTEMTGRDNPDEHPIHAIIGLQEELDGKVPDTTPPDNILYGWKNNDWAEITVSQVEMYDYVITGVGTIEADVNAFDFTNLPDSDGTALYTDPEHSHRMTHATGLFAYVGPKEVLIGLGGTYTCTAADFAPYGTQDHSLLTNLDTPDQHPIAVVTGLQAELDAKAPTVHTHDAVDVTVDMTNIDRLAGPDLQVMLEDIDELVRHGSAFLYDNTETLLISGLETVAIVNYQSEDDISGVSDPLLGTITVSTPGVYNLRAHVWCAENLNQKDWSLVLRLYRGAAGETPESIPLDLRNIPTSGDDDIVLSCALPVIITAAEVFRLGLEARNKSVTVNIRQAIFDMSWRHD